MNTASKICGGFKRALHIAAVMAAVAMAPEGHIAVHAQTSQTTPAQAVPQWTPITSENVATSIILPAGATYRLGNSASNCWAQATVQAQTTLAPVSMAIANQFPFSDPCPNIVKELDVLQTAAAQPVIITTVGAVPAINAVIVPPVGGLALTPGSTHALAFTNFQDEASSANALMQAALEHKAL